MRVSFKYLASLKRYIPLRKLTFAVELFGHFAGIDRQICTTFPQALFKEKDTHTNCSFERTFVNCLSEMLTTMPLLHLQYFILGN